MEEILIEIHGRLQKREYSGTQASLEAYRPVPKNLIGWCKDRGVDHSIADAYFDLIDRAIRKGEGQSDFAYLYEILRKR